MITPGLSPVDTAGMAADSSRLESLKYQARNNSPEAMQKVAQEFEALFLGMMMRQMRDASFDSGLFDNEASKMYQGLLDQEWASSASKKGMGLADMLLKQLTKTQKSANPQQPTDALAHIARVTPVVMSGRAPTELKNESPSVSNEVEKKEVLIPLQKAQQINELTQSVQDPVQSFIERFLGPAKAVAQTAQVPEQLVLAQAALETGWGRSMPGGSSNNLFGIKATSNWQGAKTLSSTQEFFNGQFTTQREPFRVYNSYEASFQDYANLIGTSPRYAAVRNASNVEEAAHELQKAGYATDPQYANKLIAVLKKIQEKI